MTDTSRKTCAGFSLLECIVALFLLSLLLNMAYSSTFQLIAVKKSLSARKKADFLSERIEATIENAIEQTKRLDGVHSVKVHNTGQIVTSTGEPHPVHKKSIRLRPNKDSNALSVLHPIRNLILYRIGDENSLSFCSTRQLSTSDVKQLKSTTLFLLLTLTTVGEVVGSINIASSGVCGSGIPIELTSPRAHQTPIFYPPFLQDFGKAVALLPIDESFTLYHATDGTLRYLSHRTTENQPLLQGLNSFQIAEQAVSSDSRYLNLTFELESSTKGPLTNSAVELSFLTDASDNVELWNRLR